MKVYISKYALTSGVLEIDAEICTYVSDDMIEDVNRKHTYYHGKGKNWHLTKEAAIKVANKMKEKKITSLKKQIDSLNALTFN